MHRTRKEPGLEDPFLRGFVYVKSQERQNYSDSRSVAGRAGGPDLLFLELLFYRKLATVNFVFVAFCGTNMLLSGNVFLQDLEAVPLECCHQEREAPCPPVSSGGQEFNFSK